MAPQYSTKSILLVLLVAWTQAEYNVDEVPQQDHERFDYFTARITNDTSNMQAVASELRIKYIGRVAKLDYCLFRKPKAHGREAGRVLIEAQKRDFLNRHGIKDFRADVPHQIDCYSTPNPDNAGFKKQWYLHNSVPGDGDLRVKYLWEKGITGANITVAVVDDVTHGIWPYPSDNTNTHGTNCAGIVAAKKDGICGNGVAFDARLAGIIPIQ
ncbi:pheromone processing endoprotease [Entomophthora muscae]|uniref:Pheromone processing endoprotease n=1 Tax=Entomophthora muscae TaxID=34485 RepID=A0ACC2SL79_9FUNG|nr:pheromone processing endoprotease [Entomophthora muscae]